jgi:hypothetical protein
VPALQDTTRTVCPRPASPAASRWMWMLMASPSKQILIMHFGGQYRVS